MIRPRGLWMYKTMNELLGEKYIAFIYDRYNLAAILFILCGVAKWSCLIPANRNLDSNVVLVAINRALSSLARVLNLQLVM